MNRAHLNSLGETDDGRTTDENDELFTGVGYAEGPIPGKLFSEIEYVDGLRHGVERHWYPNGKLDFEAQNWRGKLHGELRAWYENGSPKSLQKWELDTATDATKWDPLGVVISHHGVLPWQLESLEQSRVAFGHPPLPPPLEDHGHWPKTSGDVDNYKLPGFPDAQS